MSQTENALFVGRTEELEQLLSFAKEAFSGKPQIVFVTGEAGIGKTYLIERFFQLLKEDRANIVIASGQCTIESASYLPFQSILEDLLDSKKQIKVSGEKLRYVVDVVVDTIWEVGPDMIGVFGIPIKGVQKLVDKLGLRGRKSFSETIIPKDLSQVQIFGWYTKIMKDISAKFPLVLFIDDLHWSDDSSLNLLFHFGRELSEQRILVIGTYRPHEVEPHSSLMQVGAKLGRYGAKEISLDLSEDRQSDLNKTRQFVHEYLITKYHTNFSEDFERFLADRTEGNALFLSEILKNMEEKGQIAPDPASAAPAWRLSQHVARIEDLPERIESVLNERINRLEHSLREILDCASVEGNEFTAQVLMKVRQLDEWELIDELTKKLMHIHQLITEGKEKALPNGEYVDEFVFKHNLIREYIYDKLPQAKKRRIHANIGECLEELYKPETDAIAAKLATHFFQAHVFEKTWRYSLNAIQQANMQYGSSEAVRLGKMGVEALERSKDALSREEFTETYVRFHLELSKAEQFGGDYSENTDHLKAGIEYLEHQLAVLPLIPDILKADVYAQLGRLYDKQRTRTQQEAMQFLEKAAAIYEQHHAHTQLVEVLYELGNIYPFVSMFDNGETPEKKAMNALEKGLSLAKVLQNRTLQVLCLSRLLSRIKYMHNRSSSEYYAAELEQMMANHDLDQYSEIKALNAIAGFCQRQAKVKTAINHLEKTLHLSDQVGDIFLQTEAYNDLAYNCLDYFPLWERVQFLAYENLQRRERVGARKSAFYFLLGRLFLRQGNWQEAEKYFQQALKEVETIETQQGVYFRYLGQIDLLQGRYQPAESKFLQRLNILKKYQRIPLLVDYSFPCLNYALAGKITECKALLAESLTMYAQENFPLWQWEYLYYVAETYRILGEFERAKSFCRQALEGFLNHAEDPEDLIYVTDARLIWGKILVDTGEYQEAIAALEKVRETCAAYHYYALGETLLYLGKAYQGLGGAIFLRQAQTCLNEAIAECQRLQLPHKEHEAREALRTLS